MIVPLFQTTSQFKWNELLILKLFILWECVFCKNIVFVHLCRRSSTSPSYSQQTKVVSTLIYFPIFTHMYTELGFDIAMLISRSAGKLLIFFYGAMQKPWIWRNGTSGSSSQSSVIRSLMIWWKMCFVLFFNPLYKTGECWGNISHNAGLTLC